MTHSCLICNSNMKLIFSALLLRKYKVKYFKCGNCGFIHTQRPYWLTEAYSNAIADLDIGLVNRNLYFQPIIENIIIKYFDYEKKFIDFAGGYGLFVRLMRDKGFDFYRQDKYCQNIFAQYFSIDDIDEKNEKSKFEALTALEVFEHLENPLEEINNMFSYSDSVIFSTELQPSKDIKSVDDWWYFVPETGQHISFYTLDSLKVIASKFNAFIYSDNYSIHVMVKNKLKSDPFRNKKRSLKGEIIKKSIELMNKWLKEDESVKLNSKLYDDFNYIRKKAYENISVH